MRRTASPVPSPMFLPRKYQMQHWMMKLPFFQIQNSYGDEYGEYSSKEAIIASANTLSSKFSRWDDNFSTALLSPV